MAYYVDDKGTLRTGSGYEAINYSDDTYNKALRERDEKKSSDKNSNKGFSNNKTTATDYAHNKNFYFVDDRNVSDYAPYGRNEYGTPYRADGSTINYAGDGASYLKKNGNQTGYDPTGKSDLRDYKDTLKVGDPTKLGWSQHSSIDDKKNANRDVSDFNSSYGGGGFSGYYQSEVNPYKELLRQLEEARKNKFDDDRKALEEKIGVSAKEAYLRHMQASNSLSEKMAGAGLSGGATENSVVNLSNAYKNAIDKLQTEKNNGIAQMQSQYDEGVATDTAKIEEKIASQMEKLEAEQRKYEQLLEERQYEEQQAEKNYQRQIALANAKKEKGSPSKENKSSEHKPDSYDNAVKMPSRDYMQFFNSLKDNYSSANGALEDIQYLRRTGKISEKQFNSLKFEISRVF